MELARRYVTLSRVKVGLSFVGVGLLIGIILGTGPARIAEALKSTDPIYLPLALGMVPPYLVMQTLKWDYLLRKQGFTLPFGYLVRVYLVGMFYGFFTVGRVGSLMQILYLRQRTGRPYAECSGSVLLEKLADFLALALLAGLGLVIFSGEMPVSRAYVLVVVLGLFTSGAILLFRPSWLKGVARYLLGRVVPSRYRDPISSATSSFLRALPGGKSMILPILLSLCAWVTVYSGSFLLGLSMDLGVPWLGYVTLLPIAALIGLIPVTVGGWGTREAALIGLFSIYGVSAGEVVALSLLGFALLGLPVAVLGAFFSFSSHPPQRALERGNPAP
ncbi:MAG: hypothetical protein HW388_1254 [Dehalococcoidia bacterium]|nr:hypothetical protein [Dehalococcoidia bacterium]